MNTPTDNHMALPRGQAGNPVHQCSCGKTFAQQQGLTRHIREILNPYLCVSCDFTSARPYVLRKHIVNTHPGLNPDEVLGPVKSRRPAKRLTERSTQQPRSLPAVEQGQQMSTRFQPYPPALPLVVGDTSASQPATSVAHNPHPVHPGPMDQHEYAPRSEFRDAPDLPAIFPSAEGRAKLISNLGDSLQDRQLQLSSSDPGGSNAAYGPSNLETPIPIPIPIPTPTPVSESVSLRPDSEEEWEALFSDFCVF